MAQRIVFASIPNTQPIGWYGALVPLLAEVDRSRPGMRALREWLRLRNLFDKEGLEALLSFLDVRPGEPVTLGPAARALLDADDEAAARGILAERLVRENPLLAKYCLEALDVDKGGRLHSTNELYRMVTSYVYPGDKPTLGAFKAWVDWAVSAGLLKIVGIRWALGDGGRETLPRLRAMDAEEFLEDEREAARGAGGEDAEAGAEAEDGGPGEATVRGTPGTAPADAAPMPAPTVPEAGRPIEDEAAAKVASGEVEPAPVRRVAPAAPARRSAPTPVPPPPEAWEMPAGGAPAPLDLAATRDALSAWYARWPGRSAPWSSGLSLRDGEAGVFDAAAAAAWIARGLRPADAARALDALRGAGVLDVAGAGTATLSRLAAFGEGTADPAVTAALETVVALPRLHAAARAPGLLDAGDPRDLLDRFRSRLYGPAAPLAPFVLARLLFETGRLPDALSAAALVPTYDVRLNAFRIGFLDRLHAASFQDLADGALALAAWFGAPDFEGPLARVHEAYGCAFRCGHARACPLSCRERAEVAPGSP